MISLFAVAAIAASLHTSAYATSPQPVAPTAAERTLSAAGSQVEGEVRKVDMDAKKITLKHGPIKNLGMPAMSMVFHVKEAAFLEKVKEGDKVTFSAEKVDGALTITSIQIAK